MTNCELNSDRQKVTCQVDDDGAGANGSSVVTKRKYGNPEAAPESKLLLVTKNRKVRHSQACDRCRLKKVKCDGLKPKCTQCARANFRCTTSDRLTRRGFPKGYTEMLEMEVVRLQKMLDKVGGGSVGDEEVSLEEPKEHPKVPEPTPRHLETELVEESEVKRLVAEPQFPFINDTFHYYDNYVQGENYLGHRTWDLLLKDFGQNRLETQTIITGEREVVRNSHILVMTNLLQLQPNLFWLPRFLTSSNGDNSNRLRKVVLERVKNFNKFQNSLIPLLYPFDQWQSSFERLLKDDGCPDPIDLLALLFIVQINWGCMDDALLFKVTKMVCSSTSSNLKSLQVLLLGCFYFMGGQRCDQGDHSKTLASELLHLAYGMVLDFGLYINSKKLIPTMENCIIKDHDSRVVVFWTFQFLDSWWSLIQGLPKTNFMIDEFHPRSMSSLNLPSFKPLSLLLDFTTNSLDGCNLLHTLSGHSGNGKSKLIYLVECFRQLLVQWKLYHQLQDHEDEFNSDETCHSLSLTKPDVIEIQLTLFYLVISLLADQKSDKNESNKEAPTMTSNVEETAFEILVLYYLLLVDQSRSDSETPQPFQFNLLHILPCPNRELIITCLLILHDWAVAPQATNEKEGHLNWKYDKYQRFLTEWCQLYFAEDPQDPILSKLSLSFKISLSKVTPDPQMCIRQQYLQKVDQFLNNTSSFIGRSNLLRSNSNAVMDQFDMFSQTDLANNMMHGIHPASLHDHDLRNGSPQAQLTQNDNNNIIDMSNFRSQILIEHEETDDGYAEDDDEDEDEDDLKPLEIPFPSKRAGSLFHTKHDLPPSHRGPASTSVPHRRRTVDHIILEDNDFGSQTELPSMKKHHADTLRRDCMQNNFKSTELTGAYHNYSVNPPARKAMSTNSGGKNMPSSLHETILPPPPLPQHNALFDHTIKLDGTHATTAGSTNSSHTPQIVETPRAFVDMLLLQPSAEARAVIKSPPCSATAER